MSALLKLAERCEAATGPNYDLERAIAIALTYSGKDARYVPNFTASVDVALTLVPEGWIWAVDSTGRASCFKPNEPKPWPRSAGLAPDRPALAICAAALRARAAA